MGNNNRDGRSNQNRGPQGRDERWGSNPGREPGNPQPGNAGNWDEQQNDREWEPGNRSLRSGSMIDDSNWRPNRQENNGQENHDGFRAGRGMRSTGTHAGKGPKGYQRSDERIKEEVSEALSRHGDVDASEVEVAVKDGEVTLTGTVDSREAKRAAEQAAEDCDGVKDVHNQLRVQAATNDRHQSGSGNTQGQNDSGSRSKARNSVGAS